MEALIALATMVVFTLVVTTLRYQFTLWYAQGRQYLHAVSIADRTFERLLLKQYVPDKVDQFRIKTSTKKNEKIPYIHTSVTVSWITPHNQERELHVYGGMIDEA